ncbi:MAG TPA: hypothetical protein VMR08_00465 [Patescibacteria group bacterium]|jgi:hypothetical protein|nr:hypothetical protein [Patescibacteria group bacterium]
MSCELCPFVNDCLAEQAAALAELEAAKESYVDLTMDQALRDANNDITLELMENPNYRVALSKTQEISLEEVESTFRAGLQRSDVAVRASKHKEEKALEAIDIQQDLVVAYGEEAADALIRCRGQGPRTRKEWWLFGKWVVKCRTPSGL